MAELLSSLADGVYGDTSNWFHPPSDLADQLSKGPPASESQLVAALDFLKQLQFLEESLVAAMVCREFPAAPEKYRSIQAWSLGVAITAKQLDPKDRSLDELARRVRLLVEPRYRWLMEMLPAFNGTIHEVHASLEKIRAELSRRGENKKADKVADLSICFGRVASRTPRRPKNKSRGPAGTPQPVEIPPTPSGNVGLINGSDIDPDGLVSIHMRGQYQDVIPPERHLREEESNDVAYGLRYQVVTNDAPPALSRSPSYTNYRARRIANRLSVKQMRLPCEWAVITLREAQILFRELGQGHDVDPEVRASLLLVLTLRPWGEVKRLLAEHPGSAKFNLGDESRPPSLDVDFERPTPEAYIAYPQLFSPSADKLVLPLVDGVAEGVRAIWGGGLDLAEIEVRSRKFLEALNRKYHSRLRLSYLPSFLRTRLREYLRDEGEIGLICGDTPKQCIPLYYHQADPRRLEVAYRKAIGALVTTESSPFALDVGLNPGSDRYGSRNHLKPAAYLSMLRNLRVDIEALRARGPSHIAEFHNAYTFYVYEILLIASGHRDTRDPLGTLNDVDVLRFLLYVCDKDVRSGLSARILSLAEIAVWQLRAYIAHLRELSNYLDNFGSEHRGIILDALSGKRPYLLCFEDRRLTSITPAWLNKYANDKWPVALNWQRHEMREILSVADLCNGVVDHWMGHVDFGDEAQGPWSGASHRDLCGVAGVLNSLLSQSEAAPPIVFGLSRELEPIESFYQLLRPEVSQRERDRQRKWQRVKNIARALSKEYLEPIAAGSRDTSVYEGQLELLMGVFLDRFNQGREYHTALTVLRNFVNDLNFQYGCRFPLPPVPLVLRRERQSRDANWHRAAKEASYLHYRLMEALQEERLLDDLPDQALLGFILLASSLFGGVSDAKQRRLLLQAIDARQPIDHVTLGGQPVYAMELSIEKFRLSNTRIGGETKCEDRWLIDPISLCAISQYYDRGHPTPTDKGDQSPDDLIDMALRGLNIVIQKKHLSSLLRCAVAVTETLPGVNLSSALTEVAMQHTDSVSLPHAHWRYLLQPKIATTMATNQPVLRKAILTRQEPRRTDENTGEELEILKKCLRTAISSKTGKTTSEELATKLKSIDARNWSLATRSLLQWYVAHLADRGNKPSTPYRYHQALALLWVELNDTLDLSIEDEESIEEACYDLLVAQHESGRDYAAPLLQDLYDFTATLIELPDVTVPFQSVGKTGHVAARYIPNALYQAVIAALPDRYPDLLPAEIEILRLVVIIAYRTGLRNTEIAKLRLRDIERSKQLWLFVKTNRYADNKTSWSLRKIPLAVLLSEEEKSYLVEYIKRRRMSSSSPDELLLSLDARHAEMLDIKAVSSSIQDLLQALSGGLDFVFYSFRHTALSNYHVVIENEWPLAEQLTGLSEKQLEKICKFIVGSNSETVRRYWALARFAGHESPRTTFRHYLHLSSLIIARRVWQLDLPLSLNQICNLTGLSRFRVQRRSQAGDNGYALNLELIEACCRKLERGNHLRKMTSEESQRSRADEVLQIAAAKPVAVKHDEGYQILKALEAGESVEDIAAIYRVDIERIYKLLDAAAETHSIITRKKKSRTLSTSRQGRRRILLTPSQPTGRIERLDAEEIILKLREGFGKYEGKILAAVNYYLSHCKSSGSGILFEDNRSLRAFIDVFKCCDALPHSRWKIELHVPKGEAIRPEWWPALPDEITISALPRHATRQVTAYLHLRHPNEDRLVNGGNDFLKYSTSSIRYVMFMIAVLTHERRALSSKNENG